MGKRSARVWIAMGCLATLGFTVAAAESDGERRANVYMDGSGATAVDGLLKSTAQVALDDLRRVAEIPASARRTVVPDALRLSHRQAIGLRVPEGSREGSAAWFEAELIRREDAEIVLTHHDATRRHFLIAGYSYPKGPGDAREPWMLVFTPEFLHARAEFRVQSSAEDAAGLTLREVAGLDSDRIYFKATTATGDEALVSARYSIQPAPDPPAGFRPGR